MSLFRDIRQALLELELVSHAPTKNYDGKSRPSTDEDMGGKRPPGSDGEHPNRRDIHEWSAWLDSYHRRTVGYFRDLLAEEGASEALLAEIRETVRSWQVMQIPEGQPPAMGDPLWKRWVAESPLSDIELARLFSCKRQHIHKVRKDYREKAE